MKTILFIILTTFCTSDYLKLTKVSDNQYILFECEEVYYGGDDCQYVMDFKKDTPLSQRYVNGQDYLIPRGNYVNVVIDYRSYRFERVNKNTFIYAN